MRTPAEVFIAACEAQNVAQHIDAEGHRGVITLAIRLHMDVVESGILFKALDGPLDINRMPNIGPIRTLGALANVASGYPEGVMSAYEIANPSAFKGYDGRCPNGETHWHNTLASLTSDQPALAEVYVDEANTPVAIRKGRGAVPTALLLQAVKITDGNNTPFVYLPGSLVHLSAVDDDARITRHGSNHKLLVPPEGCVRPWRDVVGMNYLRQTSVAYPSKALAEQESYVSGAATSSIANPWKAVQALAQRIVERA